MAFDFPTAPTNGQVFEPAGGPKYIFDGTGWTIEGGGGGGVYTDDNPPASAADGDIWYETDSGSTFIYLDDGTSQQWVQLAAPGGGGATGDFVEVAGDTMTGPLLNGASIFQNDLVQSRNFVAKGAAPGDGISYTLVDSANVGLGWFGYDATTMTVGFSNAVPSAGNAWVQLYGNGYCGAGFAIRTRAGSAGVLGPQGYNFYWGATGFEGWIDGTNLGDVTFASDYRIKKDVADLPSTWDVVKVLRPVTYTQAEYGTTTREDGSAAPLFVADDTERWGFVAHELQETLIMSAASAVKDAPDAIQSPNPWTIIAALTKTVQEMQVRIEALEGAA